MFTNVSTLTSKFFGLWKHRSQTKWINMLRDWWWLLGWIINRSWFNLLWNTFRFYILRWWCYIHDFWIGYLTQLLFDVQLRIITNFQKYFLNHLSFYHNRYICFNILDHVIIVKLNLFPLHFYFIHMYRSVKFPLLGNCTST